MTYYTCFESTHYSVLLQLVIDWFKYSDNRLQNFFKEWTHIQKVDPFQENGRVASPESIHIHHIFLES